VDGPGVIAQVARSGRAMLPPSGEAVRALRAGTESVAVVPLPAAEGPVGVMVIGRSGRAGFSPDERAFVDVLAGVCALALERLRLLADRSETRQILSRRRALRLAGTELQAGRMRIDLEQLRIEVDGRSAHLTPTEMRLLMFLADEPGRPRSRREILSHLWQTDHVGGERTCDAHIWNLRRKIERDPSSPELVVTRRGVGYALEVA
jgi:DNA-binding winged helix-turn-helix (wHTH) protein